MTDRTRHINEDVTVLTDFMPIQIAEDRFVSYKYTPNYLQDKTGLRLQTTPEAVLQAQQNRLTHVLQNAVKVDLVLDGGNVVKCGNIIVMTEKVFAENRNKSPIEVDRILKDAFQCDVLYLPWDHQETFGHSDGIVHFAGDGKVLITNYGDISPRYYSRFRVALEKHFEVIPLYYKTKKIHARSWAYINFLQIGKLILVPQLGLEEDDIAQIVWKCFQDGKVFGDIFSIPFLLSTTKVLNSIRNYRFKIYPQNSLIPAEVWKYDTNTVLECMHNCIAHQNYMSNARIVVTEDPDKLTFENAGGFYEGSYEDYILGKKTPEHYRNPFLARAMVNVKMIDTQGYGIHTMFQKQKERYLPMPDYDDSTPSKVVLHLPGSIIDENYSKMLMERQDLSLSETVLLDRVQKHKPISPEAVEMLKKKKLIEGKKGNFYVAKLVAQNTGQKVEYSKHKGLEDKKCEMFLLQSLSDHGSLTKREIVRLLSDILPDQLSEQQKETKVYNILRKMKKAGQIYNESAGNRSLWFLVK